MSPHRIRQRLRRLWFRDGREENLAIAVAELGNNAGGCWGRLNWLGRGSKTLRIF
ncbi:MAG: hypothetical protein ACKO4S_09305 [Snowella sp.]